MNLFRRQDGARCVGIEKKLVGKLVLGLWRIDDSSSTKMPPALSTSNKNADELNLKKKSPALKFLI